MFQYISCYSLSAWKAKGLALHTSFNTSHITLYQTSGTGTDRRKQVSIHLMLLFIGKGCSNFSCLYTFQYISCYSLSINAKFISSHKPVSIHLMLLFIEKELYPYLLFYGFNTSHVTLYQKIATEIAKRYKRFNTSHVTLYPISSYFSQIDLSFQYISCYSLSASYQPFPLPHPCFNTSHVTLYR